MPDGPGGFTQDFTCPALLRIPLRLIWLRVRSFHALWRRFPAPSARHNPCDVVVLQPPACLDRRGLGSSPFARHYWGNHCCFLFLQVLRCFSSLRWPPDLRDAIPSGWRVVPFGDPRVKGYLRLTAAFRSLSRPSSPPRAKASPPGALASFVLVCQLVAFSFGLNLQVLFCTACHRSSAGHPQPH